MLSCIAGLQTIHRILPSLARQRLDQVAQFTQDASIRMESKPAATEELADFLLYLEKVEGVVSPYLY